ncbi:MAG: hypothetical protein Q4G48_10335 [Bacteroidia bacterium]|nr:hypothetical protein [Bacteroidia bacterium]
MKQRQVFIAPRAKHDILDLEYTIVNEYKAPQTAKTYVKGLYDVITKLSIYAESIRLSDKQDILRFGATARSIRYKKMAIIFTIHENHVVVRAVIPASLIKK